MQFRLISPQIAHIIFRDPTKLQFLIWIKGSMKITSHGFLFLHITLFCPILPTHVFPLHKMHFLIGLQYYSIKRHPCPAVAKISGKLIGSFYWHLRTHAPKAINIKYLLFIFSSKKKLLCSSSTVPLSIISNILFLVCSSFPNILAIHASILFAQGNFHPYYFAMTLRGE